MASEELRQRKELKRRYFERMQTGNITKNINDLNLTQIVNNINTLNTKVATVVTESTEVEIITIPSSTPDGEPTTEEKPIHPLWYKRRNELELIKNQIRQLKENIDSNHARFKFHTDINSNVKDPDLDNDNSPSGLAVTTSIISAVSNFYSDLGVDNDKDWKNALLGTVYGTNDSVNHYFNTAKDELSKALEVLNTIILTESAEQVNKFIITCNTVFSLINPKVLTIACDSELREFSSASKVLQQNLMLDMLVGNKSQFDAILQDDMK